MPGEQGKESFDQKFLAKMKIASDWTPTDPMHVQPISQDDMIHAAIKLTKMRDKRNEWRKAAQLWREARNNILDRLRLGAKVETCMFTVNPEEAELWLRNPRREPKGRQSEASEESESEHHEKLADKWFSVARDRSENLERVIRSGLELGVIERRGNSYRSFRGKTIGNGDSGTAWDIVRKGQYDLEAELRIAVAKAAAERESNQEK